MRQGVGEGDGVGVGVGVGVGGGSVGVGVNVAVAVGVGLGVTPKNVPHTVTSSIANPAKLTELSLSKWKVTWIS